MSWFPYKLPVVYNIRHILEVHTTTYVVVLLQTYRGMVVSVVELLVISLVEPVGQEIPRTPSHFKEKPWPRVESQSWISRRIIIERFV
jgi:hypothetical protein